MQMNDEHLGGFFSSITQALTHPAQVIQKIQAAVPKPLQAVSPLRVMQSQISRTQQIMSTAKSAALKPITASPLGRKMLPMAQTMLAAPLIKSPLFNKLSPTVQAAVLNPILSSGVAAQATPQVQAAPDYSALPPDGGTQASYTPQNYSQNSSYPQYMPAYSSTSADQSAVAADAAQMLTPSGPADTTTATPTDTAVATDTTATPVIATATPTVNKGALLALAAAALAALTM